MTKNADKMSDGSRLAFFFAGIRNEKSDNH